MAYSRDSPESSLSELSLPPSEDEGTIKPEARSMSPEADGEHEERPSKRQRTGGHAWDTHAGEAPALIPDDADISEDTDGSVPGSPTHPTGGVGGQDEESLAGEQITV